MVIFTDHICGAEIVTHPDAGMSALRQVLIDLVVNWSDSLFSVIDQILYFSQHSDKGRVLLWLPVDSSLSRFFAPPLIHRPCFCCLRVRAAATVARASYNWVWFPCWSIHPSHYAGNKKFMFDNDQNHCDNDNEIIWFPIGNTDTDMLRLPLLIIIEIREVVKMSKWKFKMVFAMKMRGGGSRRGLECHLPILKNDFF